MQQEDWFMRQINLLGRVLGKILADLLGLRTQGRVGEGIEAAERTMISELELDIDELISIPTDQFIETLQEGKNFSDDNLDNLAEIFFLIGEELDRTGAEADKKNKLFERSLTIYEYVDKAGSTYSVERHAKIELIKSLLYKMI
jgi:hypothetical protein